MIVDLSEILNGRRCNVSAYTGNMSYDFVRSGFPKRTPVETTMDQRIRYETICCYRTERRWMSRPTKADWAIWEKRLRQ